MDKIWEAKVDDKFDVWVERTAPYKGRLVVMSSNQEAPLLSKEVTIAFDATFGPDIADVDDWQTWALEVIDA